jgi:hypothetical protein
MTNVPEKDELNVVKMLIDISGRLMRVDENTKGLPERGLCRSWNNHV